MSEQSKQKSSQQVAFEEAYKGNYIEALDLMQSGDIALKVSEVFNPGSLKDATGKVIKSGVLAFSGTEKRMIVNKTNYRVLRQQHGADPTAWIGKAVTIGVRYITFKGVKNTPCIRVIPPKGMPVPQNVVAHLGTVSPV